MNRRSLIQALGLAPLAALISGKAEAEPDFYTVPLSEREQWERDKARWDERKLFTMTATVSAADAEAMSAWYPGFLEQETSPFFNNIAKVVQATTNTPDITQPATLKLFDKQGKHWGPTKEEYGTRFPQKPHVIEDIDVTELFRKGAFRMHQRVLIQARNIVEMRMPVEEAFEGSRQPVIGHLMRLQQSLGSPGVLSTAFATLGSLELSFFYLGPTPYPQDGRLHTFDVVTETWKPIPPRALQP